jgi:rod shape-determining protein MreC
LLLPRRIRDHRPTIILGVLVLLCIVSLASGTPANRISEGLRAGVSVVAHPFLEGFRAVGKAYSYAAGFVLDYEGSREEARALQHELDALQPRIADRPELLAENARLRRMVRFQRNHPRLSLMPAEVIQPVEVIGKSSGTLIVDRGSLHGVERFMCAMTTEGVIGVVTEVQPSLSYVSTLHSADCRIGALIQRTRAVGVVRGSGSDFSDICMMQYIDLKDSVQKGDVVVTRGSRVFPRGLPVGSVTWVYDDGTLLKTAYIKPDADPYSVDELFLVQMAQPGLEELGGHRVPAPARSAAYSMPEGRPVQERYAP